MIRILLADDHTLVRTGMRLLLESIPDFEVVAEAANGLEALRLIGEYQPDCAIMDLAMPGMSGLEAVERAAVQFPFTNFLVVSMHSTEAYVQRALSAGAKGYLLKGADKEELDRAVRLVAAGHQYLSPAISTTLVAALTGAQPGAVPTALRSLTPRQIEVLRFLAEGISTKAMAARLGLSTKTIEAHRGAIMQRLGIKDIAGLVRLAVREGLVDSEL